MLSEVFKAVIAAGVPVGVSSYLLAWWALKNNYIGTVRNIKGLEQEVKRLSKAKSKNKKSSKQDPQNEEVIVTPKLSAVHNKWLSFGGGFYGVVALLTYVIVELAEIRDFVANLGGLFAMLSNISLDTFIRLIINSLMNFVTAISWPVYWMAELRGPDMWVWFVIAYAGYWVGTRLAVHQARGDPSQ